MNTTKMADLIMEHKEAFLNSSYRRMDTSACNKLLHAAMIKAIEVNDKQHVEEMLSNKWYTMKPLKGVILCMDIEYKIMARFIEVDEEEV